MNKVQKSNSPRKYGNANQLKNKTASCCGATYVGDDVYNIMHDDYSKLDGIIRMQI
jgi:hypothetical protein